MKALLQCMFSMIIDELLTDISKLKDVCSIGIGGSCAGKYPIKN